jgi:hypothetical protein
MIQTIERNQGQVAFVHLVCAPGAHEQRVVAEDRRKHGKITAVDSLRRMLARSNLTAAIPWRENLEVDNTGLTADEVARRIVDHFLLQVR